MNKIGWIGLGKCGLPIAEKIGETEKVLAYDLITKDTTNIEFIDNLTRLHETEIVFILVQTPNKQKFGGTETVDITDLEDYDYTALESALQSLEDIQYSNTVVVSSTVSPGTMNRLSTKYTKLKLVYMPVMIHIGTVANDYISAPLYAIGSNINSASQKTEEVVKRFVQTDKFIHMTFEEVEFYKMMNNIFSSVKILFVNNISEMIEYGDFNASAWNIMEALLSDNKLFTSMNYMSPGSGNGGPCHPRDGIVLAWLSQKIKTENQFMQSIVTSREEQATALAKHLLSYNLPIVILGKSFKVGVELTDGSYSVLVGNVCEQLGGKVYYDIGLNETAVYCITHKDPDLINQFDISLDSKIVDLWNLGIQKPNVKVWGDNRKNE